MISHARTTSARPVRSFPIANRNTVRPCNLVDEMKMRPSAFTSSMMATVTNVLPSGALMLEGDQDILINGEKQKLHVTGYARPEDIDNTDMISSTRLANVHADYAGDQTKEHKGIVHKILDLLF